MQQYYQGIKVEFATYNIHYNNGKALMANGDFLPIDAGTSTIEGENRAFRAADEALRSPLLEENDIYGAKTSWLTSPRVRKKPRWTRSSKSRSSYRKKPAKMPT